MKYYLVLSCILLFCNCCDLTSTNSNNTSKRTFFDLKSYFIQEATYLKANNLKIKKRIILNDETEEHIYEVSDWEKELSLFIESDINRPSWKDRYTLDSTKNKSGITLLHYKATDEQLFTQVLDIELKGKKVHSVMIINRVSNNVYESQQYLTYFPGKSYSIKKTQDVSLFSKENYQIEAEYIKQ
jgi:hypothetical protein